MCYLLPAEKPYNLSPPHQRPPFWVFGFWNVIYELVHIANKLDGGTCSYIMVSRLSRAKWTFLDERFYKNSEIDYSPGQCHRQCWRKNIQVYNTRIVLVWKVPACQPLWNELYSEIMKRIKLKAKFYAQKLQKSSISRNVYKTDAYPVGTRRKNNVVTLLQRYCNVFYVVCPPTGYYLLFAHTWKVTTVELIRELDLSRCYTTITRSYIW